MQTETLAPAVLHRAEADFGPIPLPVPATPPDPQRAAALDQLANLWRADDLHPDASAAACQATGFATLDAELPGGGWPTGQLVELLLASAGIGELGLIVPALAQVARDHRTCVWVLPYQRSAATAHDGDPARDALPYPPALAAAGIDLARSLFVRPAAPRESLWAIEQALRAAHLGAVVGWLPAGTADGDFRALRRLQLLANRHRALVFVLREPQCAASPSPASLRLQLAAGTDGALNVTVLKRRGRPLLEPLALQVHPEHWRHARVEPAPLVRHNPAAPAAALKRTVPSLALQRWSLRTLFSH